MTVEECLKQAVEAGTNAKFEEAEALLRQALSLDPRHLGAIDSLAKLLVEQLRFGDAIPLLKTALTLDPGNGSRWLRLTDVLLRAGLPNDALTLLNDGKQRGLAGPLVDQFETQARQTIESHADLQRLEGLLAQGKAADVVRQIRQRIDKGEAPSAMLEAILARALSQTGEREAALGHFESALAQLPQNALLWYQYAETLKQLGKRDEAHEAYLKLVDLAPLQPGVYTNISGNLLDAQRYREALVFAEKGLKLAPQDQGLRINKAIALVEEDEFDEAETLLDGLLAEGFENEMSLFLQARLLKEQGFPDKALEIYRRLIDQNLMTELSLSIHMGHAHAELGNFDQAIACYENSIKHFPDFAPAWASIAHARKMTAEDTAWRDKVLSLLDKVEHEQVLGGLHYALGKYFDDTKDYDRAFHHYHEANELKKRYWSDALYKDELQQAVVDQLIAAYTREVCHTVQPGASDSSRPLFIVGMPRSGTSLTEQILSSHADIYGAGELRFWPKVVAKNPEVGRKAQFKPEWLQETARACLANLDKYDTQALRVVDKMPGNFHNVGLIHAVFPNARILHTMRNPVDTCLSIYFQNFNKGHTYANDLEDLAKYYRHYHRLMRHWREVLPEGTLLELPYEQLVEDQEGWSRRIIEFIGLPWDDRCLEFYKTERKVGTASNWQAKQPIYKTSKERWRNYEKYVGPLLPLLELYDPERGQI
jgi:tetratricopeptide (TPR) repeat protein